MAGWASEHAPAVGSGFRIVIGEGDAARDVSSSASRLRYACRLPGGFADCSFILGMRVRDTRRWLVEGVRCRVFYRGRLAWDGKVVEPPIADFGAKAIPVTALGHGSDFRNERWSKLFIHHGYDRWRSSAELAASNPPADGGGGLSDLTPGIPPGGNDVGLWIVQAPDESLTANNGKYAMTYTAPPGCEILRVKGTHYQNHINLMTHGLYAYEADEGPPAFIGSGEEVVFAVAGNASSASYDDTLTNPATYLQHFIVAFTSYGPAAADLRLGVYDHYVIGATDAGGTVFDTDDVTSYRALEALLAEYGGDVWMDGLTCPLEHPYTGLGWDGDTSIDLTLDPQYAWTDLLFENATLEEAMQRLNAPVGWEWGVFEDGRLYWAPLETIMTFRTGEPNLTPPTAPAWWYRARQGDGWDIQVSRSTTDVVNAVRVTYTDTTGQPGVVVVTDYDNPRNPLNDPSNPLVPRTKRDGITDAGTATEAEATLFGQAYLRQYGRAQVKGSATVNAQRVQRGASHELLQEEWGWAPCIRAGEWVNLGDVDDNPAVSAVTHPRTRGGAGKYQPPGELLPIRSVDVDADKGVVTLGIDTARDTFGTALARFARGG